MKVNETFWALTTFVVLMIMAINPIFFWYVTIGLFFRNACSQWSSRKDTLFFIGLMWSMMAPIAYAALYDEKQLSFNSPLFWLWTIIIFAVVPVAVIIIVKRR